MGSPRGPLYAVINATVGSRLDVVANAMTIAGAIDALPIGT